MTRSTTRDVASLETCRELLTHVSRTFALTIPLLNEPLRSEVGISYLICRMADTIEDREDLTSQDRRWLFEALETAVADPESPEHAKALVAAWPPYADRHHHALMTHSAEVLGCFAGLRASSRRSTLRCVRDMIEGMRAFAGAGTPERVHAACPDLRALDAYCHAVAGTVGILLTDLFASELGSSWQTSERTEDGRRFGLGLQLVNILKDHAQDRARGVSYLPPDCLREGRLLNAARRSLVARAVGHLDAAQRYVLSVPPEHTDMRIFCLIAHHLALATLRLVAGGTEPAKVDRASVAAIVASVHESAANDDALDRMYRAYRSAALA